MPMRMTIAEFLLSLPIAPRSMPSEKPVTFIVFAVFFSKRPKSTRGSRKNIIIVIINVLTVITIVALKNENVKVSFGRRSLSPPASA